MVPTEKAKSSLDAQLLMLIFEFSDEFGVSYPKTGDIGAWWRQALQEMDREKLYLLRESFDCSSPSRIVREMVNMLEARIDELEKPHIKRFALPKKTKPIICANI